MKIACLGWGSLIWDPRSLPIQREWFQDGPSAPIEFTRQSSDGRMTLVIDLRAAYVRLLWAMMLPSDLTTARKALRDREGITRKDWSSDIGSWKGGDVAPDVIPELPAWADAHGLDAGIWTALKPKFNDKEISPSIQQVIAYLQSLTGTKRDKAEQYIRSAPRQIDTEYRRQIEAVLGWAYQDNILFRS
jgi:hypothetical protein